MVDLLHRELARAILVQLQEHVLGKPSRGTQGDLRRTRHLYYGVYLNMIYIHYVIVYIHHKYAIHYVPYKLSYRYI